MKMSNGTSDINREGIIVGNRLTIKFGDEKKSMPDKLDVRQIIEEYVWLLHEWNKAHIYMDIDSVQENVKIILELSKMLKSETLE